MDKSQGGAVPEHANGGADSGAWEGGAHQGAGGESPDGKGVLGGFDPGLVAFHEDSAAIWGGGGAGSGRQSGFSVSHRGVHGEWKA